MLSTTMNMAPLFCEDSDLLFCVNTSKAGGLKWPLCEKRHDEDGVSRVAHLLEMSVSVSVSVCVKCVRVRVRCN